MPRNPSVAGIFYPRDKEQLSKAVQKYLQNSKFSGSEGKLKALIVPHAGYSYSGIVAGAGFKFLQEELQSSNQQFKKVILLGPSHYVAFEGASLAQEDFSTPLGIVKCGKNVQEWFKEKNIVNLLEAHKREHSLEVQLPFLQNILGEFELYALVIGEVFDFEALAKTIAKFLDEETLLVVSSDLSHYLSYDVAVAVDKQTIRCILQNKEGELIDACGKNPIKILLPLAQQLGWKSCLLDYRNSGDTSGDKSRVVGYAAIAWMK